jgi:hypothetical protein
MGHKQGYRTFLYKHANKKVDLTLRDRSRINLLGCDSIIPKIVVRLQIVYLPIGIRIEFLEDLSSRIKNIHVTQERLQLHYQESRNSHVHMAHEMALWDWRRGCLLHSIIILIPSPQSMPSISMIKGPKERPPKWLCPITKALSSSVDSTRS